MNYEDFLALIKKRRSIRRFKSDPVPEDDINKIIEAARWAPSGFNLQPWEFVVVRDAQLKSSIVESVHDAMSVTMKMEGARESWQGGIPLKKGATPTAGFAEAPVFIIPFGDTRIRDGLPMIHRYSEESWHKTFTSSLANAFLYMHLAAASLGLASRWVSSVMEPAVHCSIKQLLGIPAAMKIYDMMVLGYPDMKPPPRPVRSREEIVHNDYCGEDAFRSDDEVKSFIYQIRNPKASP